MQILGGYTAGSIVPVDLNTYHDSTFVPITFASLAVTVDINRSGTKSALPVLSIGGTDTSVKNTRFHYALSGTGYSKAEVAAGTALGVGTILADDWGLYVGNVNSAGTIVFTAAAGNFDGSYANEAAALGALAATLAGLAATQHPFGYLAVQTASGQAFIGGTDALQGGASGNPSNDTNYYDFGAGDATNSNGVIVVDDDVDPGTGGVTGYHEIMLDNSNGELGFANGDDVNVRVTAGTVNTISRIGTIIARFSIASDGLTTQQKTDVQAEADDALVARDLDHLVNQAESDDPVDNSIMAKLVSATSDWSTHDPSTDSLQALRDRGDAAWATATGFALAAVATEARLAELDAANLPTDIAAIPTTAMRGTDSAALASVATEARLAELDAANLPTDIAAIPTTAMRGTDSAALASVATEARLAELDAANLPTDIAAIPTTAMRGTDSAALASVCTEARLAELAAANIPADVDSLITAIVTNAVGADVTADVATLQALLDSTAMSEQASGAPSATPTPLVAIMYLFMQWRNGLEQTATERRLRNAAGTEIADAAMSDDGTTFDSGIMTAP